MRPTRPPDAAPVWDLPVRLLHWSLVLSVLAASLTLLLPGLGAWHRAAGYGALLLVLLRLVWGVAGSANARFSQFVRSPPATWQYLRLLLQRREPHTVGHNPLGAWMIVALLATVAGLGLSGWLYTTDRFWGNEAVEDWHRGLAWALTALVAGHLAGVLFTSLRQRENLVRSMWTGRKRRR